MTSPQSLASAIPDTESLAHAANLQILDSKGSNIAFGSLFENQKTIVVFINTTNFSGPIFADPDRSLYRALGMNIEKLAGTPSGQQRKSYITMSPLKNALQSIWVCTF
ncbi:hypothetical protein C0992_005010 [Termitomyces sp. T32_za158]|nr:hypothetical protein C0992_005010 [Termitomyces sp. T32_za158]